jgi:ribosomal protein S12 methylthiotransferase accessory factor
MAQSLSFHSTYDDAATLQRVQQRLVGPAALLEAPCELLLAPHDMPLFLYAVSAYPPHVPHGCPPADVIHGAGCGLTRPAALASALGEALERYSGWRCCTPEALRASFRELGDQGVDPQRFGLYAEAQYATPAFHFRRLHDTAVLQWVEAWSWTHARPTYLPTDFVYQGRCGAARRQACYFHTVSTGLACGTTAETAILGGLCEVIERDAIMLAWLHGLELPRVVPPAGDPVLDALYQRLARQHMRATVLDATTDVGLPVRIALLDNPREEPQECAVGMAARPDPVQAHRKALLEALHTLNYLHQLQQRRAPLASASVACTPRTFADHVCLYGHAWAGGALDMWRAGPWRAETLPTLPAEATPGQQLARLVQRLAALDLEVLSVDVTLPDVAAAGLHVFRTVVPGMVPLTVGRDACLGSARLHTVPAPLGHKARYGPGHWNPHPHPFP